MEFIATIPGKTNHGDGMVDHWFGKSSDGHVLWTKVVNWKNEMNGLEEEIQQDRFEIATWTYTVPNGLDFEHLSSLGQHVKLLIDSL